MMPIDNRAFDGIANFVSLLSKCPTDRRKGYTTRQIDFAIQALFEGKEVLVIDHASPYASNWYKLNHTLAGKIKERVLREHFIMLKTIKRKHYLFLKIEP